MRWTALMTAIVFSFLAAISGCAVDVDKSLTLNAYPDGGPTGGEPAGQHAATQPAHEANQVKGQSLASRSDPYINQQVNYEQASETETSLRQSMRAAVEAALAITGQGAADSTGGEADSSEGESGS